MIRFKVIARHPWDLFRTPSDSGSEHLTDSAEVKGTRTGVRIGPLSGPRAGLSSEEGGGVMAKPSKSALSKAGKTLGSDSSSKSAKSKAGSTLGKG